MLFCRQKQRMVYIKEVINKKIRKTIISTAGFDIRFLPETKAQPKEMLIVTGRNKKCIEDHFDKSVKLEVELEKNNKNELLELVKDISGMVDIH